MEQQIEQVVQAIAIASDPSQTALYQQALGYIQNIQQNANETWRLALHIFVDSNGDGRRKYPTQARFWALRVLDDFLDGRFDPLDPETFQTLQQALMSYIQSEFVGGPAEAEATFLRNKFSHTLTLFFLRTYVDQWPSFFTDLFTLIQPTAQGSTAGFNRHVSLLFFHLLLEISGEVADQMIKSARTWTEERHVRDAKVRDAVRERDAARINEAVLTIVADNTERMNRCRESGSSQELADAVEVVDWGVRTFGSYVGWIDINLTVTPTTVPLLFKLLADASLPIRLATSVSLLRIVSKGLKEPSDKLQLLKVLSLGEVLHALEEKTRKEQVERGDDTDEGEESYREALGKLLNVLGLELAKLVDEPSAPEDVKAEARMYLQQLHPVMLKFLADDYDDTASTVFPLLQLILSSYKKIRKVSTEPIDDQKRAFLTTLLQVILQKMKWDEEAEPDDTDDDDNAEFDKMRKDLRTFMDSILTVDQDLVTNAIRTLALQTISAYQSGTQLKWNDAELGIYLVFIFGEINKTGGKGRAAFCHAPILSDKEKLASVDKKKIDYSEFPLTSHGEMLSALVQSGIASYPNRAVSLQFFETVARYPDFFKVRKACILPALEAMIDSRGLHNANANYRSRLFYLFHRFIKECRNEIQPDISVTIINNMRDLLPIQVEIPEPEEPEADLLTEALKSSMFDSQLYLFETIGILASVVRNPEQQGALLLSTVKPFMEELSANLQQFTAGTQDLVPAVKVHHIIMALGNISKGFPDYPASAPENYMVPAVKVFSEVAQAILVCLEAMNVLKPIRDATRFAFSRILATAGPSVTHFIPTLMNNLLAHFEPSELVDFMNFIGLLIHKLQKDMFDVLDKLIGPLNAHITALLSQAASGTDELRSQSETKSAYLNLLIAVVSSGLQGIFTSERNSASFEPLLGSMLQLVEDLSDTRSQKAALSFFNRCISVWGQPVSPPNSASINGQQAESTGLPGFDRFIYERIVPTAFTVPSSPNFKLTDGQNIVVLGEIANLLQAVVKVRGHEAQTYFATAFLPSKGWPSDAAIDFSTKLQELDAKGFRKYFTDLIRASRASS
ncbi:KapM protein [Coprinellus micaceus]|uniref:Exportin-T n=1 Tax=Coprinellus micaceus TaxID=71717 RepID=A0A4Y7THI1_COPMI|nr:KapM protein [Coprinellus micaceus]